MFFKFFSYINPSWYLNLPDRSNYAYFPDIAKISAEYALLIDLDENYSSHDVSKMDAAYQAWCKGFILPDPKYRLESANVCPDIGDNYRFLRRYFHSFWCSYVLIVRLFCFVNPIREISAFWRHRKVRRIALYQKVFDHESAYQVFQSKLIKQAPKVSVIIPTLNRYPCLKDALHDLEQQDYQNFEVIVIDQSEPFQPTFYEQFRLDIQVIRQEKKALWLARNTAIQTSNAEYLLLYDDDSRTKPDWISHHLKCLDYFGADISSGVSISMVGNKVPQHYSFFRWSDQLDTGNVMIKREVFRKIGLFDQQFEGQRQGDGEFGLRAYLDGFKNISNPLAGRLHLKVGEGGLRQMGSWDGFRPKSWLAPRPVPSVLYLTRKYFGRKPAINELLINVPPSFIPYRFKRRPMLLLIGSMIVMPLFPLVFWQVLRSWRISSKMLREGAKIETLYEKTTENS